MRTSILIRRSLAYYWRTNLAVMFGVATAVAVLSGALLVGDSVRASLRDLVLARLGRADTVVTAPQFFREELARETGACPLIVLEGVVERAADKRRAGGVQVYGVDDRFWRFHGVAAPEEADREVLVSRALANELGAKAGDAVLVRVEKPSAIPRESLHGRKEDAARTIRFSVGAVLESSSLGEFSLKPTQGAVLAAFVPLRRLQKDLAQPGRVNTLLLASASFDKGKVTLEDLGIKVRVLDSALSVESESAILSDALAEKVRDAAGAAAVPAFSYLANTIRIGDRVMPYSLVTALDPRMLPAGATADAIFLNDWAAKDLGARPGNRVTLEYYYWDESGALETRSAGFRLAGVMPMSGLAVDRNLTPEYPGITEVRTISEWDPPFPVDLKRVRPKDEDYWKKYRSAPKAFVTLEAGQRLWASRFGKLTSIRVPGTTNAAEFRARLRALIDPEKLGMAVYAPKAAGLEASHGATDFGEYFMYFSFFLVASALLLTGLFFQLGVEQRLREIGTLRAEGFAWGDIRRLFLGEGAMLAVAGTLAGGAGAVGYAAFLLYGLRTWWRDAVGTSLLRLHVSAGSLAGGASAGIAVACLCVLWTLRSLRPITPRNLLAGVRGYSPKPGRDTRPAAAITFLLAVTLLWLAYARRIDQTAGFFGAGTLLLISALLHQWGWLRARKRRVVASIPRLGFRNAAYRPGRSILCIALIAAAVFLLMALDAFRRPPVLASDWKSGTGGFPLMAESQLSLFYDPNTPAGREQLNLSNAPAARFYPFRLRPGDDASCLNLYEPRNPRILGARHDFLEAGRFSFAGATVTNPWLLLEQELPGGAIPAIADANSITYVLHKKIGDEITVGPARLKLVAALQDSIFQSELIISERHFLRVFPEQQGFRFFLITAPAGAAGALEEALSDYGFDATSAAERLAAFHRVENTYLSTFQALGGLGLLLGTVGLGAVLLRNVLERRRELALLRAVGFRSDHLGLMVLAENVFLLACGMLIGTVCAFLAVLPALAARGSQLFNPSLALLMGAVPVVGLGASLVAVRSVVKSPLLASLRAE